MAASAWVDPERLGAAFEGDLFGPALGVSGLFLHILSAYAVAMLGFVGGIRWAQALAGLPLAPPGAARRGGRTTPAGRPGGVAAWQLSSAVAPPLLGWLIVSLVDLPRALWWLAAIHLWAGVFSPRPPAEGGAAVERWSPRLSPFTAIAVASLAAAALAG